MQPNTTTNAPPPIRHASFIDSAPERVFATLTSAEGWDAWFTRGCSLEPAVGGRIHFRWEDFGPDGVTAEDGGKIVQLEPDKRFAFTWQPGDSVTTVLFTLEPRGAGTVLSVHESGYTWSARDLSMLVESAAGWGEALTLLKFYLEHDLTYGASPGKAE